MNDLHPAEEKVLAYLLGELREDEQRAFEAEMDISEELRGRVRDLEEGALAIALSCPPRKVPASVWKQIEDQIGSEKRLVVFDWKWWRGKGWWAAAACLAFLLIYSARVQHANRNRQLAGSSINGVEAANPRSDAERARAIREKEEAVAEAQRIEKGREEEARLHLLETAALRNQLAELQRQVVNTAQTLAHQQALLSDPTRMKFVGLTPAASGGTNQPGLSPRLQKALFLAMARELGWFENPNQVSNATPDSTNSSRRSTLGGIDFVDLRGGTNSTQKLSLSIPQSGSDTPAPSPEIPTGPTGTLPAYVASDHVTVALDDSVAPAGSEVTLSVGPIGGGQAVVGTLSVGSNPMVITIPTDTTGANAFVASSALQLDGWALTLHTRSASGGSNMFQFIAVPGP